jgi:diguanylate cyclase (GGDEF)-like protein
MNYSLQQACVLIVDDEPANIHVLAAALQGHCQLRFATSGDQALALAAETGVDLVLLDVMMAVRDGYATLAALKAQEATREVPVIFVTARDREEDEERGLALGAVDYITKPVSAAIVRARVRTHLELKLQRDQLARHAMLDGLTGIANRRSFDARLARELQGSAQRAPASWLLLIDVDHFKQYNDHYGHGAGDECLQQVAGALQAEFSRRADLVARYGGEEFVVLAQAEDGAAQVRRALLAVRGLRLEHARSSVSKQVSISIGAVVMQPALDAESLLADADQLLYQAKRSGRDRGWCRSLDGQLHSIQMLEEPGEST